MRSRSAKGTYSALRALSAALASVAALLTLLAVASAAPPAKGGYVEDYCTKTNPQYPIEVYWGKPPAWYCTDNTSNPSKSIPFSPDKACAAAGLGPPDRAEFGAISAVECGASSGPPAHATYTLSGAVTAIACKHVGGCGAAPTSALVRVDGGPTRARTVRTGSGGAFKLDLRPGTYVVTAGGVDGATFAPIDRTVKLTSGNVGGVDFTYSIEPEGSVTLGKGGTTIYLESLSRTEAPGTTEPTFHLGAHGQTGAPEVAGDLSSGRVIPIVTIDLYDPVTGRITSRYTLHEATLLDQSTREGGFVFSLSARTVQYSNFR